MTFPRIRPLRRAVSVVALAQSVWSLSGPAAAATAEELEAKLNALTAQMQVLQGELAALKAQNAAAAVSGTPQSVTPPADGTGIDWFGYGELSYSRPTKDASGTAADVGRFVLGAGYRFDDRTRFVSELEVEHAIASADDAGEVEVEQAYIEREINSSLYAKVGLFLIPSGLLNESHEPTRYYGVFRNSVETGIIPSTWREVGVGLQGRTAGGLRWDVGVTTGSDLSKWDPASSEGLESPLGAIHQEGQLARAADLSGYIAANYSGFPGLLVGASITGGDISQGQPGFDQNRLLLWEGHARWTPGAWDLSALYAHGHISNTAQANLAFIGNPTLIPENFYGWYLQAAYVAQLPNSWSLAPFARFERVNTASSYAFLGTGLTPDALRAEQISTLGLNLNISPGVVLKLDYQSFDSNSSLDRVDIGLGYAF
jgi:hypothetical protein